MQGDHAGNVEPAKASGVDACRSVVNKLVFLALAISWLPPGIQVSEQAIYGLAEILEDMYQSLEGVADFLDVLTTSRAKREEATA